MGMQRNRAKCWVWSRQSKTRQQEEDKHETIQQYVKEMEILIEKCLWMVELVWLGRILTDMSRVYLSSSRTRKRKYTVTDKTNDDSELIDS